MVFPTLLLQGWTGAPRVAASGGSTTWGPELREGTSLPTKKSSSSDSTTSSATGQLSLPRSLCLSISYVIITWILRRWSLIAGRLPGRTDNEIKNYWNTSLRKRAAAEGKELPIHNRRRRPTRSEEREERERTDGAFASQVIRTKAHRCTRFISKDLFFGEDERVPASPSLEFEIDGFFSDGFLLEDDPEGEELLNFLSIEPAALCL